MYWKGASGGRISKSASTRQLIDAETDAHLWAERFDRDIDDLFALQSDITRRIAIALSSELVIAETARLTEHPDALDYILRGRAASNKGVTPDNLTQAVDLFEHALALDARSVEARGPVGVHAYRPRVSRDDELAPCRYRTRRSAGRASPGGLAPQHACAICQGPTAARGAAMRRGNSGIRGGDRVQSQLGGCALPF